MADDIVLSNMARILIIRILNRRLAVCDAVPVTKTGVLLNIC